MPQYLRQRKREGYLFSKRDTPPLNPPRENFTLVASGLNGLYASGMKIPARGVAALALLDDLAYFYYPLPLCPARRSAD